MSTGRFGHTVVITPTLHDRSVPVL